jgi:hypothetical protein
MLGANCFPRRSVLWLGSNSCICCAKEVSGAAQIKLLGQDSCITKNAGKGGGDIKTDGTGC